MLKYHFEKAGYKVRLTHDTNDYGADLIMIKGRQSDIKVLSIPRLYRRLWRQKRFTTLINVWWLTLIKK